MTMVKKRNPVKIKKLIKSRYKFSVGSVVESRIGNLFLILEVDNYFGRKKGSADGYKVRNLKNKKEYPVPFTDAHKRWSKLENDKAAKVLYSERL